LGWEQVAVVWADDLTADEATAFALADNRVADLGSYDDADLLAMIDTITYDPDLLAATGYSAQDLDDLLALTDDGAGGKDKDVDAVPAQAPAKTVTGDVWLLGPHRVMCGDSSDVDALHRLCAAEQIGAVLTDPPYGIALDTDWSHQNGGRNYRAVANDDRPFDASHLRHYFSEVAEQWWWGANYYRATLGDSDLDGSWLVWDKRTETTDIVVGSGFELCWSAQKHKQDVLRYHWTNFTSHTNDGHRRAHPTEKPVAMLTEILDRWAPSGCLVADLFAGSGTTLLAAHGSGRVARLMELDPKYVDVICRRFQEHTGIKPINEATGNEHDFTVG
jgi:DNA modification methylase